MPLQRTVSFINLNHENQPEKTSPPSLSPPTLDMPAISPSSRRRMGSLHGSGLFNSLSGSSPTTNQFSKPRHQAATIPYQRSLQYYKDQRQIEKAQRNGGAVSSLSIEDLPSAVSAVLHSPAQPLGPYNVGPPIIKLPAMVTATSSFASPPLAESTVLHSSVQPSGTYTVGPSIFNPPVMTMSSLHQSSLLGPCQSSLPGWPIFPPSVREPDLYCRALEKSACQTIHRTRKKLGGVEKSAHQTIHRTRKKLGGVEKVVYPLACRERQMCGDSS